MSKHDVIVVGGGPAGSTTAALLSKRGFDVLLMDWAVFPRDKSCAEYCSPGVEDALRRIGCWPEIAREIQRVRGIDLFIDQALALPIRYGGQMTRYAFTLPRTRLDSLLLSYAETCGATVRQGVRVKTVAEFGSGMEVSGESRDGKEMASSARVVVGADGLHSVVSRAFAPGVTVAARWTGIFPNKARRAAMRSHPERLGLVTHFEGVEQMGTIGEMHVAGDLYCGLAPLPRGLVNVGLVIPLKFARGKSVKSRFDHALAQLPAAEDRLRSARMVKPIRGVGPMTHHVRSVAGRGWLLVGDAAGFTDPFTGEGIYRAVKGGEIAAVAVASAVRRGSTDGRPPDLGSYASRRREELLAKELFTSVIQLALRRPAALSTLCSNISADSELLATIGNILGDCGTATTLLRPHNLTTLSGATRATTLRRRQRRG